MLDIEGTVAPISFVYDVLFPYAKKQLTAYLEKHWDSAELQAELQQLQAQVSWALYEVHGLCHIQRLTWTCT